MIRVAKEGTPEAAEVEASWRDKELLRSDAGDPIAAGVTRIKEALLSHGFAQDPNDDDKFQCPVHGDEHPSLIVNAGDYAPTVTCITQRCKTKDILHAIGLQRSVVSIPIVSTDKYPYTDVTGLTIARVVVRRRADGSKDVGQEFLHGNTTKTVKVLYRLPALRAGIARGDEVWLAEGEKSAERLIAAGKVGTSLRGGGVVDWLPEYSVQLSGAKLVNIVADLDVVGYKRARSCARALRKAGIPYRIWRSKTERKHDDIVDHFAAGGTFGDLIELHKPEITAYLDENAHAQTDDENVRWQNAETWPSPQRPYEVAEQYVRTNARLDGYRTLHFWQDDFYSWDRRKYVRLDNPQVRHAVSSVLHNATYYGAKDDVTGEYEMLDWKPTTARVRDVVAMLEGHAYLSRLIAPGSILDKDGNVVREAGASISFPNGMLDLNEYEMLDPSPALFNVATVAYDYDVDAPLPRLWLEWLQSVFPGDPTAIMALQEWFGYVLSGDVSLQKGLFLYGPKRSGKGLILRVLEEMLGVHNVSNPEFGGFGENFGMENMVGKLAAHFGEARFTGSRDDQRIVARLLQLTAADRIETSIKNVKHESARPTARIALASNELPMYQDSSAALASRFIVLTFTKSYIDCEDALMFERDFLPEMAGILQWALDGLRRVRMLGRFTEVKSSIGVVHQMRDNASAITTFWNERMVEETDPAKMSTKAEVYEAYQDWAEQNGEHVPSMRKFATWVMSANSTLNQTPNRSRRNSQIVRVWTGWRIRKIRREA